MRKALPAVLLVLGPCAASALGHGFATYVSTPITPPSEFVWWLPISAGLLWLGAVVSLIAVSGVRLSFSVPRAASAVILFAVVFFGVGSCAATCNTAPPPGLGWPHHTFWAWGWDEVGGLFVFWNTIGFVLYMVSTVVCGSIRKTGKRAVVVGLILLPFYALGLGSYVAKGAWTHGWGGGYVLGRCEGQIEHIVDALCEFAEQHDGRFPEAGNLHELLVGLEPYLSGAAPADTTLVTCPLGAAYDRNPRTYSWDAGYSGASVADLDILSIYYRRPPLICPYHGLSPTVFSKLGDFIAGRQTAQAGALGK